MTDDNDTPHDELFARARSAFLAMRGSQQPDGGGEGNKAALTHGLRSKQVLLNPDIYQWHREQIAAITADLGGESELSTLQIAHVREVARLEVILAALGDELLNAGLLTNKGKMREATTAYLHVLAAFIKVSSSIGITRVAKRVESLKEIMEGNVVG